MADIEDTASGPLALALPIGFCQCLFVNSAAWLLAVKDPETATVLAFVGLGPTAVLAVLHNVFALAFFTSSVFNYHSVCFFNGKYQLKNATTEICNNWERKMLYGSTKNLGKNDGNNRFGELSTELSK